MVFFKLIKVEEKQNLFYLEWKLNNVKIYNNVKIVIIIYIIKLVS